MVDIFPFNRPHALLGVVFLLVFCDVRILYSSTNKPTAHAAHLLMCGGPFISHEKTTHRWFIGIWPHSKISVQQNKHRFPFQSPLCLRPKLKKRITRRITNHRPFSPRKYSCRPLHRSGHSRSCWFSWEECPIN